MSKKMLLLILACIMLFSFIGCSDTSDKNNPPTQSNSETTEQSTTSSNTTEKTAEAQIEEPAPTANVEYHVENVKFIPANIGYQTLSFDLYVKNNEAYEIYAERVGFFINGWSCSDLDNPYFSSLFSWKDKDTYDYKQFRNLKQSVVSFTIKPGETGKSHVEFKLPEEIKTEDDLKSMSFYFKVSDTNDKSITKSFFYTDIVGTLTRGTPPVENMELLYDDNEISFYVNKNIICIDIWDDIEYVIVNKTNKVYNLVIPCAYGKMSENDFEMEYKTNIGLTTMPNSYSHGRMHVREYLHFYALAFQLDGQYYYTTDDNKSAICNKQKVSITFGHIYED